MNHSPIPVFVHRGAQNPSPKVAIRQRVLLPVGTSSRFLPAVMTGTETVHGINVTMTTWHQIQSHDIVVMSLHLRNQQPHLIRPVGLAPCIVHSITCRHSMAA